MDASAAETMLYVMMGVGILSLLAVTTVFVLFLTKLITGMKSVEYTDAMAQYDRSVACPKCGTAMESGFSLAPRGIQWRGASEGPRRLFNFSWKTMPNTANWGFMPKDNKAWRCRGCSMLIVDHSTFLRRKKQQR